MSCGRSARAYEVFTVETPTAFQVKVIPRPGLCDQAPEDTNLPPIPYGVEGFMSFAVRKSDFRIIRFRFPSDPFVPFVFKPKPAPPPKNAVAFVTPSPTVSQDQCSGAVTVQTRDAFDNPASIRTETSVQLQANPAKGIKLYARPDCTGPVVTRVPIAAGGNSTSLYFKGSRPGAVTLTAALGMSTATQDAVITSPVPSPHP